MLNAKRIITEQQKLIIYQSHLVEKHLTFIDLIDDNRLDIAMNVFKHPFQMDETTNQIEKQDSVSKLLLNSSAIG